MGSNVVSLPTSTNEKFSFKLFAIILLIHILALGAIGSFTWFNFAGWIISHLLIGTIGGSIGLHRYFSHKSFSFKSKWFKVAVTYLATICFQGGPIFWATVHREHHRRSEGFGDAHSAERGFLWAHIGWLLYLNPNGFNYVKSIRIASDLKKDKIINFFELYNFSINIFTLSLIFFICSCVGHKDLFFWIGPLRIVSVWHCAWLINSYSHGARFFKKKPTSIKNSNLVSIIIGGEGDHKYHHDFPSSIKHTGKTFHLDYSYTLLKLFKALGLVDFNHIEGKRTISSIQRSCI